MPPRPVIEYRGSYDFDIAPSALWALIEHGEQFERWWPWLEEFSLEGGTLRPGAHLRGVVVPPLPYRMRLDVEVMHCLETEAIDVTVNGDLEGTASLTIHESGPGRCKVEVMWSVEMMQRPMRIASRFAHPLLQWGHSRVVELTVRSFRRHISQDLGGTIP